MKKIPMGIENFKRMIDNDYYFVDKTMLIKELIDETVVLYTRPRRFGKTLNMSMLYYFFSNKEKENAYLFDGLAISQEKEILKHQNSYPVLSLTLKDMKNNTFEKQLSMFSILIKDIIRQNSELLDSLNIDDNDKETLSYYYKGTKDEVELQNALKFICTCMKQHYGKNVIILIDEYDVPLQDAYLHGYYEDMTAFIRNVFSAALKTNNNLEKGILTGCLRIAKESIFTGLNNFSVYSIFSKGKTSSYFGFTQQEVDELLEHYDLMQYKEEMKEWYDGYLFGNTEIYNPWSVLKYIKQITEENDDMAQSYWANTSGNDIVYQYIQNSDEATKEEFKNLVQGKAITKTIMPEMTYREMDDINNIYSFLLFTGYLKTTKTIDINKYELMIPNKEIRYIYMTIFEEWFRKVITNHQQEFAEALMNEDEIRARKILNNILFQSISYYDGKEEFYHGFLAGMLQGYPIKSNRESGNGRFDIVIIPKDFDDRGIIIECKKAGSLRELKKKSEEAAIQIKEKGYIEGYKSDGYTNFIGYGISFYGKSCYITKLE